MVVERNRHARRRPHPQKDFPCRQRQHDRGSAEKHDQPGLPGTFHLSAFASSFSPTPDSFLLRDSFIRNTNLFAADK